MEYLITAAYLAVILVLLAVNSGMALLLWRCRRETAAPMEQPARAETEEEKEARRLAAEAQMRYEQGFVNLMSYDGRPNKTKEGVL